MQVVARVLAGISAVLLLVNSYHHSTGIESLSDVLASSDVPDFFVAALSAQWLFFSWHLAAISVPLLWAALSNPSWFLAATIFCCAVSLGDFFWVYSVAGWFSGSFILLAVVLALVVTSALLVRRKHVVGT